jgi:polysaccharide export outer membrane protein
VIRFVFENFRVKDWILRFALLFLFFGSPSSSLSQNTTSTNTPENFSFIDRVHQGDVIDIHVPGYLEFDWRGSINPEGFLDGFERLTSPVYAQCLTLEELEHTIDRILSETLRAPKTRIKFVDRSKRPMATIDGAIRNPQRMQIRRGVRLSEIIVNAGGFTDRASGGLMISRPTGASCIGNPVLDKTGRIDIAISDLLAGKSGSDPIIVSGDLIVVIEASPVFLLGAVQGQGRIDYRTDLTVTRAIDSAGGLAKNARPESVKIFRRDPGPSMIPVDLEKIQDRPSEDVLLRPFDIIDVPFRGKPPRTLPPVIEIDQDALQRRAKLPVKIIE